MVNYLLSHRWNWSTSELGLHTLAVTTPEADVTVVAGHAATAFAAAWDEASVSDNLTAWISSAVEYEKINANEILDLNLGTLAPGAQEALTGEGGTGNNLPPQVSTTVSLIGGTYANGANIRGRFYLPTPSEGALAVNATISTTARNAYVALIERYFFHLNANAVVPSVWTRKLGQLNPVTQADIGDVADTIRSRREALVEIRSPITV